jgi:small multidrug resistance pump
MTGSFADRLFRISFTAAGIYNIAFGLWAALWPLAYFRLFEIAPPRYPQIWACVGMIVGIYGLLYLHAAWKLDSAWPVISIGLLGKVLGPIGMAMSLSDDWPRRLGMLCVYNDVIWWLPFGLFLIRRTWLGGRIASLAPWLCVSIHASAVVMLGVFLRQGTQTEADVFGRADYVARHPLLWTIGWATWMAAAASLVGFYAWWGSQLEPEPHDSVNDYRPFTRTSAVAVVAIVIAAIGMVFDFSGEASGILRLTERVPSASPSDGSISWDPASFMQVERDFRLCSAGAANGLYTVAGIMLQLVTTGLPQSIRAMMWATWIAGAVMTIAALFNYLPGMVISTAALFPMLLAWVAWMGARWRPR